MTAGNGSVSDLWCVAFLSTFWDGAGPIEQSLSDYDMLPYGVWRRAFASQWRQGEHVALVGQTGSGKTYTARDVLAIRQYVIVLAVKREDDTLNHFSHGEPKYKRTKKWPVDYNVNRAVISLQPKSLGDRAQAGKVYEVLNDIFKSGGWCTYLDDTGYLTSTLGLKRQITVLLNQGRSHGISVVTAATQPTSVAANIPSETMRQVRHILMWKYEDAPSIRTLAELTGYNWRYLESLMHELYVYPDSSTDFIAYRRGHGLTIVHQER